jgi:transposase
MGGDQKKANDEGRTIVFVDASGFYLLPHVVRTYAPRGQTPIIREVASRDHLAAMSGITPQGKLYSQIYEEALKGDDAAGFLKYLLLQIPGPILVAWDGAPIHRSKPVKDLLTDEAAGQRLWLERLPAYAPDLNPDEGVWAYLKGVELRNVACDDMAQLRNQLSCALERLREKPAIITSFFAGAKLPV